MANCTEIFNEFNKTIKLTDERRETLRHRRNNLRGRISGGYDIVRTSERLDHEIEFQSQGSYVMDTIINPSNRDDQYDIDDGVYFLGPLPRNSRPEPATFHNWIIRSIESGSSPNKIEKIVDKNTCVRVEYKGFNGDFNYHVDIPIYYAVNVSEPDLADKKEWWHLSNPVEFIIWFENIIGSGFKGEFILERKLYNDQYLNWRDDVRKRDHQLRRIVRYLKAWGDFVKEDMPPGIVMTILAGENYSEDMRDDISLKNTLVNTRVWLTKNGFKCPRPTTPVGEDLFKDYSPEKREFFKKALDAFIEGAINAIQNTNQKSACLEWQKYLGNRFPCHLAKDERDYSSLSVAASKSDMWSN